MIWVLQLVPDSLLSRMGPGFFAPAPTTERVSRSEAIVARRIVRAVILLYPRFGHGSVRHHVEIVFVGIEEKLGAVTRAGLVCQWNVGVVLEPGRRRLNENFVEVAAACAEKGEGEIFVRNSRGNHCTC